MELAKPIVLALTVLIAICIPVFVWLFVKTLYHYQRMINGIKKSTYTKGFFILGPLLLANEKYFEKNGQDNRILFFAYLKKASIVFSAMLLAFLILTIIKTYASP